MSGGAAGTSSRAQEPEGDESDRDEDQDEQTSFVLQVVAGRERGSLCLDDAADWTVMQSAMRPRCRQHRFCQPSRQHRQSWTTT
jgi:hypothetical protein